MPACWDRPRLPRSTSAPPSCIGPNGSWLRASSARRNSPRCRARIRRHLTTASPKDARQPGSGAKSAARGPAISHTPDPPHAFEGQPMTLPAPRRGRTFLFVSTAAAVALVAGPMLAAAQPPPAGAAPPAGTADTAKKAPAKAGAAKEAPAKTSSASYSVGVSMGEQLRASGVPPDLINAQQLAQGVHDAISGKASMTDKDRENLRGLVDSVGESNHRAAAKFLADNGKKSDVVTTASGLQYKVLAAGSGASPKPN